MKLTSDNLVEAAPLRIGNLDLGFYVNATDEKEDSYDALRVPRGRTRSMYATSSPS